MRKSFMPREDKARRQWLKNFVTVLQDSTNGLAAKYGISGATIAQLNDGSTGVDWTLNGLALARGYSQSFTSFKDAYFFGSGPLDAPTAPATPKAPAITFTGGVFNLAGDIGSQIKRAPNYTVEDGELLGLEGAEETMPAEATTAPQLDLRVVSGGLTELVWRKGMFDGIKIEVDRGDGWKFLAIDTEPNYIDTVRPAAGQSAIYKYRAIYMLHDAEYGQWSDVAETTVRG